MSDQRVLLSDIDPALLRSVLLRPEMLGQWWACAEPGFACSGGAAWSATSMTVRIQGWMQHWKRVMPTGRS